MTSKKTICQRKEVRKTKPGSPIVRTTGAWMRTGEKQSKSQNQMLKTKVKKKRIITAGNCCLGVVGGKTRNWTTSPLWKRALLPK